MATRLISSPERVFDFLNRLMPMQPAGGMKGIGLERDGELVAGVLYEGYNGVNVWMHVGGVPGSQWMTKGLLRIAFDYPFNQMGVQRVSGYVNASNHEALRLNRHLGFQEEATLHGAAPDGGNVLILVMRREHCRHIKRTHPC